MTISPTPSLACTAWLRVRERIEFKLATLAYKLLRNQTPVTSGFSAVLPTSLVVERSRSANTNCLMVPHVRLSSVGNRTELSLLLHAPRVWNSLPIC